MTSRADSTVPESGGNFGELVSRLVDLRRVLEFVYASERRSLDAIAEAAATLFDADVVAIRIPDLTGTERTRTVAGVGLDSPDNGRRIVRSSRAEILALSRGWTSSVPTTEPRPEPHLALPSGLGRGVEAVLVTPLDQIVSPADNDLSLGHPLLGVLVVGSRSPERRFGPMDRELIKTFASACSGVLRNERMAAKLAHAHERSVRVATLDTLTGLSNRQHLLERLNDALTRPHGTASHVGVVFIDLDDFRLVNENFGHEVGDRLLAAFSARLRRILRLDESAAHLAADEFVVLLEGIDHEIYGHLLVERVRIALGQPFKIGDVSVACEASFGLAIADIRDGRPRDAPGILRDANVALYRAKAEGKARSVVFDQSMRERTLADQDLASSLRHAVRSSPTDGTGALELLYQPVVDLVTGAVSSVEALLRWHRGPGDISPDDFIPIAESTGLIAPLGRWVLESACRHLARFREVSPGLGMGINLSGRQLGDLTIVADVDGAIRDAGVPATAITLEVTETYLLERSEMAVRCLHELRGLGVRTALDDFGTGYSSLTSLQLFRFDICKVDRAFVQGLERDGNDRVLGEMLIGIGRQLDMKVVGEGVETSAQLDRLRSLHCDYGQGFFLGRPMRAHDLVIYLGPSGPHHRFHALPSADAGGAGFDAFGRSADRRNQSAARTGD